MHHIMPYLNLEGILDAKVKWLIFLMVDARPKTNT